MFKQFEAQDTAPVQTVPAPVKSIVTLVDGDCLELLAGVPDGCIDLLMLDLPYNTTKLTWDKSIDPVALWSEFRRVLSDTGTIVAFGAQPFTTDMINIARDIFRYSMVWEKEKATNPLNANRRVMRLHEDILVFSKGTAANHVTKRERYMTYNPQGLIPIGEKKYRYRKGYMGSRSGNSRVGETYDAFENHPVSVLKYAKDGKLHETQKPVALLEYLIRTFSNPGDMILDPTMGSGSTGVACVKTGRHFIGFEKMPEYFDISVERIGQSQECNPEPDVIARKEIK